MPVPLRRFSQNWLANDELAAALVRDIAPRPEDHFLEIGAGEGRLTRALLRHPVTITAVELDRRCCSALRELADEVGGSPAALSVMEADILEVDAAGLGASRLRLVGNLPYAIASPILRWTAKHHRLVVDAHYMLPADLADRVLAAPGSSRRGLLSVLVAWFFDAALVRRLGPGAFRPPPKIDSVFLRLLPHEPQPCAAPPAHRRAVVAAAFAHKRKQLRNALQGGGWSRESVEAAMAAADVPAAARAEDLSVAQFARLAEHLPELTPPP